MTDEKTVSILDNCYCQCTWSDDGATKLTILTSSKSWSGVIDDEALDTVRNKLGGDIKKKDMIDATKKAFGGETDKYSISVDEENNKLLWKKVGGKVKIKLVAIDLVLTNFEDTQKIFMEQLIKDHSQLRSSNIELVKKQESLENDLQQSQFTLEIFEKEKSELEDKLYSRFLPILNAKKDEILRLQNVNNEPEEDVDYGGDTDVDEDDGETDNDGDGDDTNGVSSPKRART